MFDKSTTKYYLLFFNRNNLIKNGIGNNFEKCTPCTSKRIPFRFWIKCEHLTLMTIYFDNFEITTGQPAGRGPSTFASKTTIMIISHREDWARE